jgi:GMP synthase (glutamine-hydrolysing)
MGYLAIIEAGRTFSNLAVRLGDFSDWMAAGLGVDQGRLRIFPAFSDVGLPSPRALQGVVISGSHAMVTEDCPWMRRLAEWLAEAVALSVPVLGICFGHQMLARALGGVVDYHPRGREVGTVKVCLNDDVRNDPLFSGMPECFSAQVFHAQSVLQLPPGCRVLAGNDFESHQAVAYGDCAWGLQFHPEFDARIMRSYIAEEAGSLMNEGYDVGTLLAGVEETPVSAGLLANFAKVVG